MFKARLHSIKATTTASLLSFAAAGSQPSVGLSQISNSEPVRRYPPNADIIDSSSKRIQVHRSSQDIYSAQQSDQAKLAPLSNLGVSASYICGIAVSPPELLLARRIDFLLSDAVAGRMGLAVKWTECVDRDDDMEGA